jgi:GNAT superfamily N-acetyltransferase
MNDAAPLALLITNGVAVFSSPDDALLSSLRQAYAGFNAAWFFDGENLSRLTALLAPFHASLKILHLYYVPRAAREAVVLPSVSWRAVWYEGAALERFAGDARFLEALGFHAKWPDMLAVTAEEGGKILGMAGASRDSDEMWQIGINVEPFARGLGIAQRLVTLLRDAVLARGIVPFYGTAASHILSQRVAAASGFIPLWAELIAAGPCPSPLPGRV